MKELLERVEELLYLQERLVNLLLLSRSQRIRVSISTAFELLYHNIELLELLEELLGMEEILQEEYRRDYSMNLLFEALSWMGILLPAIEESCPIFLQKEQVNKISLLLKTLEEIYQRSEYGRIGEVATELHSFSSFLKHQIMLARKAYMNLA